MTLIVNGRFLAATPTGLHRTARSLLDAAMAAGLDAEVRRPGRSGRLAGHLWEQVELPAAAGRRPVLSLANTAPVAARRGAVLVHDLAPLVGPHWFRRSMQLYAREAVAAARRAEVVCTVSAQVARQLEETGVRRDRISVVRPAVDPSFGPAGHAAVEEARSRFGLDQPYLLFVGWADPRKDAASAVLAHLEAARAVPHTLVLAGLAHRNFPPVVLPDAASVRRVGYTGDADLRALLTGAAALVYPSRYEGFGLPPLEAWACGTPAIVGDTPAQRESTEGRGVYVAPGDISALKERMLCALTGQLTAPEPPAWTWGDAAAQLLEALARM